jgi:hypothetical protein
MALDTSIRTTSLVFLIGALASQLLACGSDEGTDDNGSDDVRLDTDRDNDGGVDPTDGVTDVADPRPPRESVYVVWSEVPVIGAPADEESRLFIADEDCRLNKADMCEAGSCEPVEILSPSVDEQLCANRCELTSDLSYIVYIDSQVSSTLRFAPLGDDFQLAGDSTIIATEVFGYSIGGNRLAYRSADTVYTFDLQSGTSTEIVTIPGTGGVYMSPDGQSVYVKRVNNVTGTIMDLLRYNADGTGETLLYTFVDADVTGSLLSGNEPIALSPDGQTLAIATNYRYQSNLCASNADCTEPGYVCPAGGVSSRCYAQQLAVQSINLGAADRLGEPCSGNSECGDRHTCDLTAPDDNGQGLCMPGRTPLGYSGQNRCSVLRVGQYDSMLPGLSWTSNQSVVALAANSCGGQNIEITDLIQLDITSGVFSALLENPGRPFGGCVNELEQCYDTNACNVEFYGMSASPAGAWIGLTGDSYSAASSPEVWLYDVRDDEKFPLTRSLPTDAQHVQILTRE